MGAADRRAPAPVPPGLVGSALLGASRRAASRCAASSAIPAASGRARAGPDRARRPRRPPAPPPGAARRQDRRAPGGSTERDQPQARIEELDGLATWRLLRAAERAGVDALRVLLAARRLAAAPQPPAPRQGARRAGGSPAADLRTTTFAPSLVYRPATAGCAARAPRVAPRGAAAGLGAARTQPIWADDVADCVLAALDARPGTTRPALRARRPRGALAPEIAKLALRAAQRRRLVPRARGGPAPALRGYEALAGPTRGHVGRGARCSSGDAPRAARPTPRRSASRPRAPRPRWLGSQGLHGAAAGRRVGAMPWWRPVRPGHIRPRTAA